MKLSVLIPSIPSRISKAMKLYNRIAKQCEGMDVEILIFIDNKKRSIGYKRDALVQIARGRYCAFVDDDDDVSDNYISCIIDKIDEADYDVISINTLAIIEGKKCKILADVSHENEELQMVKDRYKPCKRKPFHTSVWKTEIAQSERFKDVGYGEDWDWVSRLLPKIKTSCSINQFLYRYIWSASVSEAPTESNEVWTNPNE
jgi:glycosyltransferase involved in cell wall biosynthesis